MTSGKVFYISVKENPTETINKIKNIKNSNKQVGYKISYLHGLQVFGILFWCAIAVSVQTLIPRNNSIMQPTYWYEINIAAGMPLLIMAVITILECSILTENKSFISVQFSLKLGGLLLLAWITSYCACFFLWSKILEYNHPMPFLGLICYYLVKFLSITCFWFLLPASLLREKEFKQKLRTFMLYQLVWVMVSLSHNLLSTVFRELENTDFQCIVAVLIPIFKGCSKLSLMRVVCKTMKTEKEMTNVNQVTAVNISYGLFIATNLTGARIVTVFGIVIVEFLMQLRMTHQIVQLHKKVSIRQNKKIRKEKKKAILSLILAEMCEGLVFLAYALCLAMSYYGPNTKLTNGVGIGIWGYDAIVDDGKTFLILFGLFSVDLMSFLLNAFINSIFCNVNIFYEFCVVLKKYWYIIALHLANSTSLYFLGNDINFALDWTLRFCWITNGERCKASFSSTDM